MRFQFLSCAPTFEELAERLRGRATEDESKIQHRLQNAREEAQAYPEYDYLIINAEIPKSVTRLETIVNAERLEGQPAARRIRAVEELAQSAVPTNSPA